MLSISDIFTFTWFLSIEHEMQQKSTLNISLDKYYSVYNGQKTIAMMKSIRV